jgi:ribosomal protein L32
MIQDRNTSKDSEERATTSAQACPICGHAMREHTIDHSTRNTVVNCPVPHPGAWDRDAFEPVNEFGMVIHGTRT